jgi:hypothetical protein
MPTNSEIDAAFIGLTAVDAMYVGTEIVYPAAGPAIEFIGVGAQSAQNTAVTITAAWPAGYTAVAGDVAILVLTGSHGNTSSYAPDVSGISYTQIATVFQDVGSFDAQCTAYYKVLTTAEAAPAITVPTPYAQSFGVLTAQVLVYRNVHASITDAAAVTTGFGTSTTTPTPIGITTVTNGAVVLSIIGVINDNALAFNSGGDQGFTLRAGGADYDTTIGGDFSVGIAEKVIPTAGAVTCPTWLLSTTGEKGAAITIALKPA